MSQETEQAGDHIEEEDEEELIVSSVIIDNGSWTCKAGFAGENHPRSITPTLAGRPLHPQLMPDPTRDVFVGDDARNKRGILSLVYPVRCRITHHWDDLERIWHALFYEKLKVSPEDQPVLLTEPLMNPKANRERTIQIFFDEFDAPAVFVGLQPVLALYASGRTTGCVVDCGHDVSHTVSVYAGYPLPHSHVCAEIGGRQLTEYLNHLLEKQGHEDIDAELVRDMKELLGWVSIDYDLSLQRMKDNPSEEEVFYELPSGDVVVLKEEQFRCCEALFRPEVMKREEDGIQEWIRNSIERCDDEEMRKEMYSNVVLAGGTTMFPGIAERLSKELSTLVPDSTDIQIIADPNRDQSVWIGGSIVASLATFQQRWITKAEYEKSGPSIVHEKCF